MTLHPSIIFAQVAEAGGSAGGGILDSLQSFTEIFGPAGKYIMALIVFLVGRWIAKLVGKMVTKGLDKTEFDDKLAAKVGVNAGIGKTLGMLVFFILLLFVLMLSLDIAGMTQAVEPLKDMLNKFLGYIPNLVAGGILAFIVVMIAKVVKGILEGVLGTARVDERLGMTSGQPITSSVSNGVFYFIILLMLPAIMRAFNIQGLTEPVVGMVDKITNSIPNVLVGLLLLGIGYLIANVVQKLAYNGLNAANVNGMVGKLGVSNLASEGAKSPAGIISYLIMVSILVVFGAQALDAMNLEFMSKLSGGFADKFFDILGAVIVAGLGVFGSNLAYNALKGENAGFATIVKWAILIFVGFIALSMTGVSTNIVETPFLALVIAAAVALGLGGALAIGKGGEDAAKRFIDKRIQ